MVDVNAIHSQVLPFFREGIQALLPETSGLGDGEDMRAEG